MSKKKYEMFSKRRCFTNVLVLCLGAMTLLSACDKFWDNFKLFRPASEYYNQCSFEMNGEQYEAMVYGHGGGLGGYPSVGLDLIGFDLNNPQNIDSLEVRATFNMYTHSKDYWADELRIKICYSQIADHIGEKILIPAKDVSLFYYRLCDPPGSEKREFIPLIGTNCKLSHPHYFEIIVDSEDFAQPDNMYSLELHFSGEGEVILEDRTETYSITNGYYRYNSRKEGRLENSKT